MSHHLLVDGTLKTDTSKVNSLSDFSRKSRLKGTRDISVLYAFDLEKREPVCSKCYPGNMLDVTAYESFITKEEQDWLKNAKKDGTYSAEVLAEKQKSFGTIVLESDCDLSIENAYAAYAERWEIEVVMRYYKSVCQFDDTRVQDDYSVIGSEFCDFLATVLTFRLIKAFDGEKLLEKHTYKKVMATLKRAKKVAKIRRKKGFRKGNGCFFSHCKKKLFAVQTQT